MPLQRSFQPPTEPPPPPQAGIFDAPATSVSINRQWAKFVISALAQLQNKERWSDGQNFAKQEIIKLIECLITGSCEEGGIMLNLRFDMTDCVLKLMHIEGESETELASVDLTSCVSAREVMLLTHDGNVYWRYTDETTESNRFLYPVPTNGQDAPIPGVSWFDNGAVVYLRLDVDGDGLHDYESPNLKGTPGTPGANGKELMLNVVDGNVYWRYVGELVGANRFLYAVPQDGAQGEPGAPGADGADGADGNGITQVEHDFFPSWHPGNVTYNPYNGILYLGIPRGADGKNPEFRVGTDDDIEYIQWRLVGDTEWNNLIPLEDLKGEQGIQGIQGLQGIQGVQGVSGVESVSAVTLAPGAAATASYNAGSRHITFGIPAGATSSLPLLPDALPTNADDNICSGVQGVIEFIWDRFNHVFDEVDLAQTEAKAKWDAIIAIAEGVTGGALELAPADEILKLFNDVVLIDRQTARVEFNDPDWKEEKTGELYCLIVNEENKSFTQAVLNEWLSTIVSEMDGWGDDFEQFVDEVITHNRILVRYQIYGASTSNICASLYNCDDDTWTYEFNFKGSASTLGWARYNASRANMLADSGGMYPDAVWVDGNGADRYHINAAKSMPYADATTRISSIKAVWANANQGNGDVSGLPNMQLFVTNSAGNNILMGETSAVTISLAAGERTISTDLNTALVNTDTMRIWYLISQRNGAGDLTGASGRLEKIVVTGSGKNPFIP